MQMMIRNAIAWLALCLCLLALVLANRLPDRIETQTEDQLAQGKNDKSKSPEIERLVTQLGDKDFEVREAASRGIEAFGLQALEALREAASAAKDAEIRK